MKSELHTEITIIGAGLTGLTLAFYLQKNGRHVTVVESEERTGGVIRTLAEQGFIYETGPNTGVLSNMEIAGLFEDLGDACEPEIAHPYAKSRWIWKNGKWHALPSGLISAVSTPLFTVKDKFRILGEPFRQKGNDPFETVAAMVTRRLGVSYLKYAVDPFISGIYAGDPARLVTRYALPKLYNLEQNYGSFIRGAIFKKFNNREKNSKKVTKEVFSVKGGLQNLTDALTGAVGEKHIITGCRNVSIYPAHRTFITETGRGMISSGSVITTTGGYSLPALLSFVAGEKLAPVTTLEYAGIVQVVAGFKKWEGIPLNAFGGLIPTSEKRPVLGILFPSSIFSGRAPESGALLSVFMGGIRNPGTIDRSDEDITAIVLDEIRSTLGIADPRPDLIRIFRYRKAIPQYESSTAERLTCIGELQDRYPGLILAGNIRDGIGIADRVKQARILSNTVMA